MTSTLDKIVNDITAEITAKQAELDAALASQKSIADLRADIGRLESAKLALTAKQTPDGRKRISEAARKPRKKEAGAPPVPAAAASPAPSSLARAICDHCKRGLLTDDLDSGPTWACGADGCDFMVHANCLAAHRAKFHWEDANA